MRTRALGASGLAVSTLGLGLAALGRPGYINVGRDADLGADRSVEAMERRCHDVLDAAFDAGIRYLDAARSYGLAERFLAAWLRRRGLAPGAVTVGSKWGYTYTAGWEVEAAVHESKDLSAATLQRQLTESRDLLGPYLQLYQIHSATIESGVLDDRQVIDALRRLRGEGLAIGLTVTGPRQADTIRRAIAVETDGLPLFQTVQATWNLLEVSAGPALAEASAAGCGVIVKEALANGRLTDRGARLEAGPLRSFAETLGLPLDRFALAAAIAQPWADVVLSGAVTTAQLQANLAALTHDVTARESPPLAEPPDGYWARRSARGWG